MMKLIFPALAVITILMAVSCGGSSGPTGTDDRELNNNNGHTTDELGVAISPHTLHLSMVQRKDIVVHTTIPYDSVDNTSLELNGIPVKWTKADDLGHLVANFDQAEVKAILSPGFIELTLTGTYTDGEEFAGSDTVRVKP